MSASRIATAHQALNQYYNGALTNTVVDVHPAAPGNLYGFLFDNNTGSADVFIQVFNKAAADVTLGTTVPDFTYRIPAGAILGKDPQEFALYHYSVGFSMACTAGRTNATAPGAACTATTWDWHTGY